jgi:hypothetical protein
MVEKENFIDQETISMFLDFAKKSSAWEKTTDDFWDGRVLRIAKTTPEIKTKIEDIKKRIKEEIKKEYGCEAFCDTMDIVQWPVGTKQPPHIDACAGYEYREFGSIIYLNDDYSGGKTYYVNLNTKIKPESGKLIIHRGDKKHAHGVTEISDKTRYTLASFWYLTKDNIAHENTPIKTFDYINSPGNEVPDNTILIVPDNITSESYHEEIVESMSGKVSRDWFVKHFYFCTPLVIGNQYGFVIRSTRSLTLNWRGGEEPVDITYDDNLPAKQVFKNGFRHGILTIQNRFAFKTPPGINLMTIQPPNLFIPGTAAMTGVIETDNIRRDFTFNLKVTVPNYEIKIKIGDPIGAFIPIARGTVEKYNIRFITDLFSEEQHLLEIAETRALSRERNVSDITKPHGSGRRYSRGVHTNGDKYNNHQSGIIK